jgi:hypothetical protein
LIERLRAKLDEIRDAISDLESEILGESRKALIVEDYNAGLIAWDAFRNGRMIAAGDLLRHRPRRPDRVSVRGSLRRSVSQPA